MKYPLLGLCAVLLSAIASQAAAGVVSPEVTADRHLTFRMYAPAAGKVVVAGQWDNNAPHEMTKGVNGGWSVTICPVNPGFWIYNFSMDGIDLADPVNPQIKLRTRTSGNHVFYPWRAFTITWSGGNVLRRRLRGFFGRDARIAPDARSPRRLGRGGDVEQG